MSMGYLRGELKEDLTGYLRKVHCLPLCPLHHNLASDPDKLFSELNTYIAKLPLCEQVRRSWVSDETCESIDSRVTALWEGDQVTVWKISRHICAVLRHSTSRT